MASLPGSAARAGRGDSFFWVAGGGARAGPAPGGGGSKRARVSAGGGSPGAVKAGAGAIASRAARTRRRARTRPPERAIRCGPLAVAPAPRAAARPAFRSIPGTVHVHLPLLPVVAQLVDA